MKRYLISLFIIFCMILNGCSPAKDMMVKEKLIPLNDVTLKIISDSGSINETKREKSSIQPVYHDTNYQYDVKNGTAVVGQVKLKLRTLDNGDQLVMTQLLGKDEKAARVTVSLPFKNSNRYEMVDWDQRKIKRPYDKNTGIDETTQPIGLFRLENYDRLNYELVMSKNYVSKALTKKYDDGYQSNIREFIRENKALTISNSDNKVNISFQLSAEKGQISEQWFLLTKSSLFKDPKHLQSWIDYNIDSYKEANGWLTIGGPLKKLPYSVEPVTKKGYGRNLGVMIDREAVDRYFDQKERYFYDLMLNSVADLYEYRKEKDTDIWETEYTSTWLKKAYGLQAPYIDTRHNEFIALYLGEIGTELKLPDLKAAQQNYGDYLLKQIKIGNVIKGKNGLLISDYFSPYDQKQKTHTSLNHALGGANLLLDCYFNTGDKKYLDAAIKIRTGIEELGDKWIRDTGDLWYQVKPDLTFTGNDYEQLTLVDMLNHQQKWEKTDIGRSVIIDKLIRSKVGYLVNNKKILYDDVIQTLIKQGFEDVLPTSYKEQLK